MCKKYFVMGTVLVILATFALSSFASPCEVCSTLTWQEVTASPKSGGYGQALLGTGDALYLLRAWSTGSWHFWRYDPESATWQTLTPPPERPKNGTAMTWDGLEHIYVLLGGAYDDRGRRFFYRYHIASNSWERLADTPGDQGAGNAITWSFYDSRIYAFIGHEKLGSRFASYDPKTNKWKLLTMPAGWNSTDDGASLVWAGGPYLYALRGEYDETRPAGSFARYRIDTQTWERLSDLPDPAGVGDGASLLWIGYWVPQLAPYVFALGGGGAREEPGYSFFVFDTYRLSWARLADLPCPVGQYNGNRLAYAAGALWYWQGAPSTWSCGGTKIFRAPICISVDSASQYLGATAIIIGVVAGAQRMPDGSVHLNLRKSNSEQTLLVLITGDKATAFDSKIGWEWETKLIGARICITGQVQKSYDQLYVALGEPEQILPIAIPAAMASQYYGQEVWVYGIVASVKRIESGTVFLNFIRPYPEQVFTIMVDKKYAPLFDQRFGPQWERGLVGQIVCVYGLVKEYQGKPEILPTDPTQLRSAALGVSCPEICPRR